MKLKEETTQTEVALLFSSGLILTIGAVWWISGFPVALLILGLVLLTAAWSCVETD